MNSHVMLGSGGHGVCFEKGKGVRLWDVNGKSYIDCTSQGWAMYLGHANDMTFNTEKNLLVVAH